MRKFLFAALCVLLAALFCFTCGCRVKNKNYDNAPSSAEDMPVPASSVPWQAASSLPEMPDVSSAVSSVYIKASAPAKKSTQKTAPKSGTPSSPAVSPKKAVQSDEMRAVWFTYLEFDRILKNKTEKYFSNEIAKCFDNCVNAGINAVIVQVRSHGDALYPSSYYPASSHFTGKRTNTFAYDPLQIMISAAHARGLKIHAWINPFRGPKTTESFAGNDIFAALSGTNREFTYGGYYYLDPGYEENRRLIVNGVKEVASKYAVDGIHFDDRFYPTSDASVDAASYASFGGGRTLSDYRLGNVNTLIKEVYAAVKSVKNIPFGISPQGNVSNDYNNCFADVKLWGSTAGYADYLAPQLYWSYGEGSLPYEKALEVWKELVTSKSVKLVAGLAPYKVGTNAFWSGGNILCREIADARNADNYAGFILYRYDNYFSAACGTERQNVSLLLK